MKKKFLSALAIILIIALSSQLFASFAFEENVIVPQASETSEGETEVSQEQPQLQGDATEETKEKAAIIAEDTSRRNENEKHFRLSDGTFTAAQYPSSIHFKDEKGEWQDIDNSLSLKAAEDSEDINGFANKAGELDIKFANNSNASKLLRIKKEGYEISWGLASNKKNNVNAKAYNNGEEDIASLNASEKDKVTLENEQKMNLEKIKSTVKYTDIFNGTDIEYIVNGNDVKENIIIKSTAKSYSYEFELRLKKLSPVLNEDGSISIYDSKDTQKEVFKIPAPYMYDANGEQSLSVHYELETKNGNSGKYTLRVVADTTWINADGRAFPVTVDPVVLTSRDRTNLAGATVADTSIPSDYPYGSLYVGHNSLPDIGGNLGALVKFSLPTINPSDVVIGANVFLAHLLPGEGTVRINVSKINSYNWTSQGIANAQSSAGMYSTISNVKNDIIEDSNIANSSTVGQRYVWDITKAVKSWYNGSENCGLFFWSDTISTDNHIIFMNKFFAEENNSEDYSNGYPFISITYVNTIGLESYQSYHTASAGRAGTAYINDYSGSATFSHKDFTGTGERLPVSISHIYNNF